MHRTTTTTTTVAVPTTTTKSAYKGYKLKSFDTISLDQIEFFVIGAKHIKRLASLIIRALSALAERPMSKFYIHYNDNKQYTYTYI